MKQACVLLAALLFARFASAELLAFGPDSLREIERRHAGSPFAVVIWSIDCAPCRDDLALLRRFTAAHPEANVVLISADDVRNAPAIAAVLAGYGLSGVESWVFADPNHERLQYAIDPQWFGEMPRAYLYSRANERKGISGTLSSEELERWLMQH
jgi:hypothetical protein